MTLAVVLCGAEGIVLGADTRSTTLAGTLGTDASLKGAKLANRVGLVTSGDAGLANTLVAMWLPHSRPDAGVTQTALAFMSHARKQYAQWFPSEKFAMPNPLSTPSLPLRPYTDFCIAGLEENGSAGAIYYLNSANDFAPQSYNHGYFAVGKTGIAAFLFNRMYGTDLTIADLSALAAFAITETMRDDSTVGGFVALTTITTERGYEAVADDAIYRIIAENTKRAEVFWASFRSKPAD
ncbi:MAG: hypothetical protein JWM87_1826 [Candidatus Eremiobacteraeota bacterium]|nr:hypothetical protein [Candidatus Eremiobacteraeota bacterium]